MQYDIEKVLDFSGDEPEWKYRVTLSAAELDELGALAESAVMQEDSVKNIKTMLRYFDIGRAFRNLARQLKRRDLDSVEGFKANRPLPVPAMGHASLDCE